MEEWRKEIGEGICITKRQEREGVNEEKGDEDNGGRRGKRGIRERRVEQRAREREKMGKRKKKKEKARGRNRERRR